MKTVAALAVTSALVASACHRRPEPRHDVAPNPVASPTLLAKAAYRPALLVPHTTGPIHCDGRAEEPDWRRALRSHAFRDARTDRVARPYSEARFLWDDSNLYVLFYAGDDDIRSSTKKHDSPLWMGDAFSFKIRPDATARTFDIDFAADGTTSDAREASGGALDAAWESHAEVGVDTDGTFDDAHDEDEEWLVEARIPLVSLGAQGVPGARFGVRATRCDTPRGGPRGCGTFAAPRSAGLVELELRR